MDEKANVTGGVANLSLPSSENRIPFFHDFSCRQEQLATLDALVKRALVPGQLDNDEVARLRSLAPNRGAAEDVPIRSLVFVAGGSGMGKSRLLQEVGQFARGLGIHVQEVFCHERQGIPFLPILRMVKALLARSPSRERLWQHYGYVLTRVFPELASELGEVRDHVALPGDDGKIQLFDALAGILAEMSRERPLLLLIHDLHRGDPGTVEFLGFLGRNVFLDEVAQRPEAAETELDGDNEDWKEIGNRLRPNRDFITAGLVDGGMIDIDGPGTRLMVIANLSERQASTESETPRERTVSEPDRAEERVLERVESYSREPYSVRVELPSLEPEETELLVTRTLGCRFPEAALARIHQAAGGNPLHAIEICRYLFEMGGIPATPERGGSVEPDPEVFARAVEAGDDPLIPRLMRGRTGLLAEPELRIVQALAAIRRPVRIQLLEQLLGLPREQIRGALVSLEGRELVKVLPVEGAPLFFLVHEDYTRGLYGELGDDERRELHSCIGATLAGHERSQDPVRAFEIYEHLRLSSNPRESIPWGLEAARYFARAYALDAAVEIESHLLELLSSAEDRPARLELLAHLSDLELRRGECPTAKAHAKRLIEEGEADLAPDRLLEAMVHLSDVYRVAGEPHKGIKTLNRALKRCGDDLDPRGKARIAALLAGLRLERQDPKRAIDIAMRGLNDLAGLQDVDDVQILLLDALAQAHLAKNEMVAAIHHYQRLLELVEKVGDEARMASTLSTLGRVYYDRGNYFRAARYLFRALDVVRRMQDVRALSRAYDALGKVYRNSGDHLRGLEYFNRSLRLRERIGDYEGLSPTLNSLGSLYAHMGDYFRGIRYFKRSVENSERFGDTAGIVRAFLHLARSYYEIGELRQVESLTKQILILSQEFGLGALEGEGHRLQGNLQFLRGDWKGAEKEYRKSVEIVSRRGRKNSEAAANLDLGQLLAEKEQYESALKLISKGQLLAEEIQSTPLQAKAYLLKGNVYWFLKGGNLDRAREAFRKGLELVSGEHHLPFMWELDYSIAKVFQANRQYAEAGESYRRAERILERIASTLPEDMKVVYYDDRRRKVFYDDLRRFEKEASGRAVGAAGELPGLAKEEKVWRLPARTTAVEEPGTPRAEKLVQAAVRIGGSSSQQEWADRFLQEARRLSPSPRGFLLRKADSQESILAATEMGPTEELVDADRVPGAVSSVVLRKMATLRSDSPDWVQQTAELSNPEGLKKRSILAVPLVWHGKAQGVVYLERPTAQNAFSEVDQQLIERLVAVTVGHFLALERLQELQCYRGTPILTAVAFEDRIWELAEDHLERQRPFVLLEAFAPGLDALLDTLAPGGGDSWTRDSLAAAITEVAGLEILCCGHVAEDDIAFVLSRSSADDQYCDGLRVRLEKLLAQVDPQRSGEVQVRVVEPEAQVASVADLVSRLMADLQRRQVSFNIDAEIERLTAGDLSLKEAKTALERRYITAELLKSRGNITRAAESLGVHRPQLSNLIKKHNVRREDFE